MAQVEADRRYKDAMKAKGFISKRYWVHESDVIELKEYADKLRKAREENNGNA